MTGSPVYLFVGPTAYDLPSGLLSHPGLCRLPPAARGSIADLVRTAAHPPANIVLVDGRFGDVMAVSHREILEAIDRGWRVCGLASMGALRAAELHTFGMIGFGEVFRHFRDTTAPDDEVAVLHGPEPDYRPVTEALVDLRCFLRHLVDIRILASSDAAQVEQQLAARWFGDRSFPAFVELCRQVAGADAAHAIAERRSDLPAHRIKSRDLRSFLRGKGWL
jgi:hypothetical protein